MAVAALDDARRRIASAAGESELVAATAAAHDAVRKVADARAGAASLAAA
ncbi:hypothetical protein H7J34_22470, partial [Mycolicibacterium alvei]|nr:hypothetical protein [Mycolicibacterium alvei]